MSFHLIRPTRNLICNNAYRLLIRSKHQNHPGHKLKPYATPVKFDLPDRYLDEPMYPPVKPKYPPGYWPLNDSAAEDHETEPKLAWHYYNEGQKYHSLKTIQERLSVLAYLNVQQTIDEFKERRTRYYPIYQLGATPKSARMLPFNQYITKTHVSVLDVQNENSTTLNSSIDSDLYEKLKKNLEETVLINLAKRNDEIPLENKAPNHPDTYVPKRTQKEANLNHKLTKSNQLIKGILDTLTSALSTSENHLINALYGVDVNIKSYWKRCGFKEQKPRGAVKPDPDSIRFQFEDVASYQIKCDKPLKPMFKLDAKECITEPKVPEFAYNPSNFKVFADHLLPMQVPGHWYGDSREFNFLTVYNTTRMFSYLHDKYPDLNEDFDALKSMAITAGHAELTAQAYYLGFSMWKDLTYPLMGQLVLTNGQDFSFVNYQLNTLRLWNKATPQSNLCYITVPERLYELNDTMTECKLNDNVFKKLLNTLLNKPIKNDTELVEKYSEIDYMIGGSRLRPYLSVNDFEKQLSIRRKLFAISLYELVKYDRPTNYLNLRSESDPVTYRPKFDREYDKLTYEFRDIVLDYYPRDYYGYKLLERILLRKAPKQTEKFWDLKHPVYEWATVPPPDTNDIKRNIDLPKF